MANMSDENKKKGSTETTAGLAIGATIGAAVGGPLGALVGGILGGAIGNVADDGKYSHEEKMEDKKNGYIDFDDYK